MSKRTISEEPQTWCWKTKNSINNMVNTKRSEIQTSAERSVTDPCCHPMEQMDGKGKKDVMKVVPNAAADSQKVEYAEQTGMGNETESAQNKIAQIKHEMKREKKDITAKNMPVPQVLFEIVTPLLYWYRANARVLPWREDPKPYHVWLSEIMLQQTRVEAVKPYYARFLEHCPDVASLAVADDGMLHKLWEGLGYYSRVRNLKKCAQQLMTQYDGEMPADYDKLKRLAGIGPYTAGAICSIAFGLPTPAVDGNVLRVVMRLCGLEWDIGQQTTKKQVFDWLQQIYPPQDCGAFTQALMELGALVCVPNGAPLCAACPLSDICKVFGTQAWQTIPYKAPKKARRVEERHVWLLCCNGKYALCQRPQTGLLSGLWEFVSAQAGSAQEEEILRIATQCGVLQTKELGTAKHIFTHLEWHMTGTRMVLAHPSPLFVWATPEEIRTQYAIPSAYRYYSGLLTERRTTKK